MRRGSFVHKSGPVFDIIGIYWLSLFTDKFLSLGRALQSIVYMFNVFIAVHFQIIKMTLIIITITITMTTMTTIDNE